MVLQLQHKHKICLILILIVIAIISLLSYHFLTRRKNDLECTFSLRGFAIPSDCTTEFLDNPVLRLRCPPAFQEITPGHLLSGFNCALEFYKMNFHSFEEEIQQKQREITWENIIEYHEIIEAPLNVVYNLAMALVTVQFSKVLQDLTTDLSQQQGNIEDISRKSEQFIFAVKSLRNQTNLSNAKKAYLSSFLEKLKSNKNSKNLEKKLAKLGSTYSLNVRSSTKELSFLIYNISEMDGIPLNLFKEMSNNARKMKNVSSTSTEGPWLLTINDPVTASVITYSNNRELRRKIYSKLNYIGYTKDFNNSEVIEEMRSIYNELANINGYENYVQYQLQDCMVQNISMINTFLENLYKNIKAKYQLQMSVLNRYAKTLDIDSLSASDISYLKIKYRMQQNKFSPTKFRQYFPRQHVLNEMLKFVEALFKVTIKESKSLYQVYTSTLKIYEVYDADNALLGMIYFDLEERKGLKLPGAYSFSIKGRFPSLNITPIAIIATNFDHEDTLSHHYISILFHEMGHAMQKILKSKYTFDSFKDTKEVPSKFMEHFCNNIDIIRNMSSHIVTGEKISKSILGRIINTSNDFSALELSGLLSLAILDQAVYRNVNDSWEDITFYVIKKYYFRFIQTHQFCDLMQIFLPDYDYGGIMYTYLWSEAIAIEIHNYLLSNSSAFAERALIIRELLFERKNLTSAAQVYEQLLGKRYPDERYFLRYYGIEI